MTRCPTLDLIADAYDRPDALTSPVLAVAAIETLHDHGWTVASPTDTGTVRALVGCARALHGDGCEVLA